MLDKIKIANSKAMESLGKEIAKIQNVKPTFKQRIKHLSEKIKEICKK